MDLEQDDIIAGYGVLDNFIKESLGNFTYVGPTMNQVSYKTNISSTSMYIKIKNVDFNNKI